MFPFPSPPWFDWRVYARALRMRRGAMVPMLMFCGLTWICVVFLACEAFAVGVFEELWRGSMVFVCPVGTVAGPGTALRSLRAIYRLGVRGWFRPRPWFEVAYVGLVLSAFSSMLVGFGLTASEVAALQPWLDAFFRPVIVLAAGSFWTLMVAALVGYVAAAVRRRRPSGRVFRAVQFWFMSLGGIILATIGGVNWPPPRAWPEGVFCGGCLLTGLLLLSLWVMHMVKTYWGKSFDDL